MVEDVSFHLTGQYKRFVRQPQARSWYYPVITDYLYEKRNCNQIDGKLV